MSALPGGVGPPPWEPESPLGTLLVCDAPQGWAAGMLVSVAQGLLLGGHGEKGFLFSPFSVNGWGSSSPEP